MALAVVALDYSLGMEMRGWFDPARRCAIAASQYLAQHPDHQLAGIVRFADRAHLNAPAELPDLTHETNFGTNLEDAVATAMRLVAGRTARLIVFSDFIITSHLLEPPPSRHNTYFSYPPAAATTQATITQLEAADKAGIRLDVFRFRSEGEHNPQLSQLAAPITTAGGTIIEVATATAMTVTLDYLASEWP